MNRHECSILFVLPIETALDRLRGSCGARAPSAWTRPEKSEPWHFGWCDGLPGRRAIVLHTNGSPLHAGLDWLDDLCRLTPHRLWDWDKILAAAILLDRWAHLGEIVVIDNEGLSVRPDWARGSWRLPEVPADPAEDPGSREEWAEKTDYENPGTREAARLAARRAAAIHRTCQSDPPAERPRVVWTAIGDMSTGDAGSMGESLAAACLAAHRDELAVLTIDMRGIPAALLISGLVNGFLDRMFADGYGTLHESLLIRWETGRVFQRVNIARWISNYEPGPRAVELRAQLVAAGGAP